MIENQYTPDVYTGNGVTTSFAYGNKITDKSQLKVTLFEIATEETEVLVVDSDYTVSGVGEDNGGNVTYNPSGTPMASTHKLIIERVTPTTQDTDYEEQGAYSAEVLERSLDKITAVLQEHEEQIARSPKVSVESGETGEELIEEIRAAKVAAEAAQTAAEAAQAAAELAETHAETAETNAETAETNAETAETNAEAAQAAAEAARDAALTAETNAETAETNAETAETNAETAAATATTQAGIATTKAAEAAASAAAALTSENNAETAETNAETAETNAEAAAAAAALSEAAAAASAAAAAASSGSWEESTTEVKTANYPLVSGDKGKTIVMNGASLTATLPDISGEYVAIIKNIHSSACTIAKHASDTLEKTTLAQYECVVLVADTTNNTWRVVAFYYVLPTFPAGTIADLSTAQTFTNKRHTKRIGTTTSSATPTPDADAHDQYNVTALAAGATFAAPTGTPTDGQILLLRVKDNATARTLAFNAIYRAIGITLPTTTVISKTTYVLAVYNAADTKWDCLATGTEA